MVGLSTFLENLIAFAIRFSNPHLTPTILFSGISACYSVKKVLVALHEHSLSYAVSFFTPPGSDVIRSAA